ncbi:MAG: tetratricopeptide repeat protein [Candidatus Omnitrophica bacterium]|nr:tetratricopeptide repeat protein [Candidatus Omnitrophota bacterium]
MPIKKISFVLCVLCVLCLEETYALNLGKLKVDFLNGDYQSAISTGEKILSNANSTSEGLDELYYLLGLSYLKEGNFLRAEDIFEIILKEFKTTKFKDEAMLGLGDVYFLKGNLDKAQATYKELISKNPDSALKPQVYYRLSQIAFKKADLLTGKEYLDKLKKEFPQNIELQINSDISSLTDYPVDLYYTVQVGSFSRSLNAQNLKQKLINLGYPAYIEEISCNKTEKRYRVRVGRLKTRAEAVDLANKLIQEGYPTKIYP